MKLTNRTGNSIRGSRCRWGVLSSGVAVGRGRNGDFILYIRSI